MIQNIAHRPRNYVYHFQMYLISWMLSAVLEHVNRHSSLINFMLHWSSHPANSKIVMINYCIPRFGLCNSPSSGCQWEHQECCSEHTWRLYCLAQYHLLSSTRNTHLKGTYNAHYGVQGCYCWNTSNQQDLNTSLFVTSWRCFYVYVTHQQMDSHQQRT